SVPKTRLRRWPAAHVYVITPMGSPPGATHPVCVNFAPEVINMSFRTRGRTGIRDRDAAFRSAPRARASRRARPTCASTATERPGVHETGALTYDVLRTASDEGERPSTPAMIGGGVL